MKKLSKLLAFVLVLSIMVGMLTLDTYAAASTSYTDVDANAPYAGAVKILTDTGILNGIGNNLFAPATVVTRAQAITALGRLADVMPIETDQFSDVVPNSWYSGYVGWAVENGIVEGDDQGRFLPNANVTSEHLDLMLSRYAEITGVTYTVSGTDAGTVTRADLAQRLLVFLTMPEVAVTGGVIRGYVDTNGTAVYKGIPYAAPTSGENRWADPQPVEPWGGVKDCIAFGDIVLQDDPVVTMCWTDEYIDVGMTVENGMISEDSLNLNIWTQGTAGDKLPVIVYIHGGGNTSGSNQNEIYTGENIARKGVVYVAINYRVGPFGFLAYKDETGEATGNYALKDQIYALKWVQENIAAFGGDADNVTIVGQSAGSQNIQMLVTSPAAKGLFDKAVALSKNIYDPNVSYKTLEEAQEANKEPMEALGYTMAELRAMSTEEVYELRSNLPASADYICDGEYVTQTVAEAYASGNYNTVNMLMGHVTFDAMMYAGNDLDKLLENLYNAASAKNAGDPGHKTYLYYFSHPIPDDNPEDEAMWGAFHTGDVSYWLDYYSNTSNRPWSEWDYELGDIMSSYLVNFAATGDPNGDGLPEWTDLASAGSFSYMHFDDVAEYVVP